MDRKFWQAKLQLVKNAWRGYRREEKARHGRVTTQDFGVTFSRSLTDNIEVNSHVSGWQIDDSEWSLRVRIAILDPRVAKLRSEVMTSFDSSNIMTLDFDVLAAAAALDGCELEPSPSIEPDASDDHVRLVVKEFSDKIDQIWAFAGGFTITGLETLSIWAIRNRAVVGVPLGPPAGVFGDICTAAVYGERELAREFLWEYEIHLKKRRRVEVVNEPTRAIHEALSKEVSKLRSLLS